MTHLDLLARLARAWTSPLPGANAQALMAPAVRGDWPEGLDPRGARHAAGLLLLFPVDAQPHLVLTVRSDRVRHGGQVSLPGGVIETGEDVEDAALREAREEVALDTTTVRILGRLTPLDIPVSGFRLHPVVAVTDQRPVLTPADEEVARILDVPVATLLAPQTRETRLMMRGERRLDVPVFAVGADVIWGATAMVLAEFLALIGWSAGD